MSEKIILVDPDDHPIGEVEKIRAHQYGMLHRAFSVIIFRKKNGKLETLLQQRAVKKYHGGGLWTNTCCSHPHPYEVLKEVAEKRLKEEMGISVPLKKAGKFHYIAQLDHGMIENEIDHVFIGEYIADIVFFNTDEVKNFLWIDVVTVQNELVKYPEKYTPWFKQVLEIALSYYQKKREF